MKMPNNGSRTFVFVAVISILVLVIAVLLTQKNGIINVQQCSEVRNGSTILADYTIGVVTQQGISILDTNVEGEAVKARLYNPFAEYLPANITISSEGILPGVREGLIGMKQGEEKRFLVTPEKGYGNIDARKREVVTNDYLSQLGVQGLAVNMQVVTEKGNARVVTFNETHTLLDYNPILAGQTMAYKIKVLEIKSC